MLPFGALGVGAWLLDSPSGHDHSQLTFSVLSVVLGIWVFWRHGAHQITAAGLYSLASAMFVGVAGISLWAESRLVPDSLFIATAMSYWIQVALLAFWPDRQFRLPALPDSHPVTGWAVATGFVVSVTGIGLTVAKVVDHPVVGQLPLGALALLTVGLVLHRSSSNKLVRRLPMGAAVVVIYSQTVFTGYGRLGLVALGLVAAVVGSMRTTTRRVKGLMLAAVPPVLLVLVEMREAFGERTYGVKLNGFASVTAPLRTFGDLIVAHQHGAFSYGGGDTFWATAVFWVPRSSWDQKPLGFGAVLTGIFEPQLAATGQSLAALSQGEWFYDFGFIGVAAMVPIIGLFIRWLDTGLQTVTERPISSRRELLWLTIALLSVVTLPDLMWAGSFTYVERAVVRIAMVLALLPFAPRARPALTDRAVARSPAYIR